MLPYFQTNNTALAVSLALCGVPAPKDDKGRAVPQIMLYSAGKLRGMGYREMTADEAASRALREKRPGMRVFQFERTPDLEIIVKAFQRAHTEMEAGSNVQLEKIDSPDVAAVVYAASRMRNRMLDCFSMPAFITSEEQVNGAKTPDGGWRANGSFSAISVGASEKLKAEVRA